MCSNSTCQPQLQNGGACESADMCRSGHCFEGACTPRRAAGQSCDQDLAPCVSTSACVDGTCVELPHTGDACDIGCYGGFCFFESNTATVGVCRSVFEFAQCW